MLYQAPTWVIDNVDGDGRCGRWPSSRQGEAIILSDVFTGTTEHQCSPFFFAACCCSSTRAGSCHKMQFKILKTRICSDGDGLVVVRVTQQ